MQISSPRPIRVTPVRPSVAGAAHQPVKAKAASKVPPAAATTKAVATKADQPRSLADRLFSAVLPKGSVPMVLLGFAGLAGGVLGATALLSSGVASFGLLGSANLLGAGLLGGFVGGAWVGDGLRRLYNQFM